MAYDATLSIGLLPDDSQLTRTLRNLETHAGRSVSKAITAHTQPLGRITGQANEFQKSLAASNARVIAFGASTGILFAMKSAFQQLVHATIDVQKEMTEVNAIFRLSSTQLKTFSNDLFALANNYGLAFSDASKVAVEFARQGAGVAETLKRTSAALALARISGLGFEEAVSSLTSILNTFQKEGLQAMDVINRIAAVDQNFAISAGAMADALSRVSSSAADANVSLNETLGLIAAAKQITGRTGSVIGNSFKTMFTRLQRPEVLDDLEAVGVKARDAEGKIRPMLDILRSLSATYDTLATSQKSFVAETVGGVYQINILKAIMRDLGSGMSIVDGAMRIAGESTGLVNQRMEVLNDTISSQLIRTANNLKLAFYNIGTSLVSGPLSTGLSNFDTAVRSASKYTDSTTTKEGSGPEKATANFVQGSLKGLANFAVGPGLQFLATTLFKLFERLSSFIVQSGKDLSGITEKEKQREALNQGISAWLGKQDELLKGILDGNISLADATERYLNSMKGAVATAENLKAVTESIGIRAITQVTFTGKNQNAAEGYIPNLEIAEASRGGYQAGRVFDTTINDGSKRLNIMANGAETVARVSQGGKAYDFINPPASSPAGRAHRQESLRQTGIDPYALPNMSMGAKGFIPNLALSPDLVQTIINLGIDPKKIVEKARLSDIDNFTNLPQDLVSMFVSRYRHDTPSLTAALVALTKKGANIPLNNGRAMANFLSGFMLNSSAKTKGIFSDMSQAAVESLTQNLTGQEAESPQAALAKIANATRLRPQDVQKIFSLHSKSIPFIAGYESPDDLSDAKDRPNNVSSLNFPIDTGKSYSFRIETPIYGFKGNIASHFSKIEALMKAEAETNEDFTPAEIGTTRGVFFDKKLRSMAKKEGVKVGDPGSALDIYGPVRSILSKTSIKNAVAGMELKASAVGAVDSGNMAEKLFRTFAGEPGGGNRKPVLKGPVGYVPKLTNIQQFNGKSGGIGIIDADKFGGSDSAFNALIYAATASGKPLRIHYGPMTTGKTTAAEKIVNRAGGLGGPGGDYITDINQIDSDEFKQFIINKTDRKNLDTGVFGLALSAASQVRAFYSPYSEYKAKQEEMVKRLRERNRGKEGQNAEAISRKYDEPAWKEYADNIDYLEKKLGPERVGFYDPENPHAARGFIPNLALTLPEIIDRVESNSSFTKQLYAEEIIDNPEALKLLEGGWKLIGRGAESYAFRKNGLVFKMSRNPKIGYGHNNKEHASLAGMSLFEKLGVPFKAKRVRSGNVEGIPGLLQRFSGETLESVSPKLGESLREYLGNKWNSISSEDKTFRGKYLAVDFGSAANFTVGNPNEIKRIGAKVATRDSEDLAKNSKLMEYVAKRANLKAIDLSAFARGHIPNLFLDPMEDALKRENKATGGNAIISSHPMLRTNTNPLGLAAIDTRYQKDAGEAMQQHMSMGQSLTEVRSASTAAKGYVPNLAVSSVYDEPFNAPNAGPFSSSGMFSSLLLAIAGAATKRELGGPKTRRDVNIANGGWLSHFASDGEKAAAKLRVLAAEFDAAKASLHKENSVTFSTLAGGGEIGGKEQNKFAKLETRAAEILRPLREAAAPYQKAVEEAARRASKIGIRTATIASLGGGVASQFASTISPTAGEAVNEFASGATQAGQLLLTFPGKFGWIGAISIAGGAAISALDVFSRGMANSIRDFEISHAHTETVNNQLDALAVAMNQYDTLIGDATSSLSAIDTAQRDYSESLAQLKTSALGRIAAEKLESAPDTKSRINTLLDFKNKNVKRDNLEQSSLAIEKFADRRKFFGSESVFGIKPLGHRTETQKTQIENSLRTGAGDFIREMDSGLKGALSSVNSIAELDTKLRSQRESPDVEISESAKELIGALNGLEEKIGKSGATLFKQNVVNQLQNEAADQTPERQAALNAQRYRAAQRQSGVTNALNEARLRQRIFVNSGALNAQNQFNLRDVRQQANLNETLVNGNDSVARREANAGLYRQQFGERTVKTYETATEVKRIGAEGENKISQVRTDAARNIFSSLTQNFDQISDNLESFKKIQAGGSTPTIADFKERFLTGLNSGVTKTVSGNLNALRDSHGQLNTEKVINKIVENSGTSGDISQSIKTYLQANVGSADTLKMMLDASKQEVSIQQETNTNIMRQGVALEGFLREMDFKQLANYMGGIKSLLDRNSRRTLQRNLVRGAFLMERGRTSEAKATGASLYLGALKEMQIPLDRTKNTALSRSIGQAFDTLIPNLADVQRQMAGRVANSSLVRNGNTGAALQELAGRAGIATATAAAQAAFQPENPSLAGRAQLDISTSTKKFNDDLFNAASVLESFSLSVLDSLKKKQNAEQKYLNIKIQADKDGTTDRNIGSKERPKPKGTAIEGQDSSLASFGASVGPFISTPTIGTALTVGYLARKQIAKLFQSRSRAVKPESTGEFVGPKIPPYVRGSSERRGKAENLRKLRDSDRIDRLNTEAESFSRTAPEPPTSVPKNAKERSAEYRQKKGLEVHERKQARENRRVERKGIIEDFGKKAIPEVAENIRESKVTLRDRIKPSSRSERLKFVKEPASAFKTGGGKTALIAGILTLLAGSAINQAQGAESNQGEAPEETKFTKPTLSTGDILQTGIATGANAAILKTPNISKLGALRKGALLAATGLISDKIEDSLGGGVGAQTVGAAINVGAAGAFFGPTGAAGAAIGIGSEKLRNNYTEKRFGYGAGLTQGFLGSIASGATIGAAGGLPGAVIGGAVNGGLYLGSEALSVRGETKDAEAEGRMLDAKLRQLNAYRQAKAEGSVKTTTQNAKISESGKSDLNQDILKALQDINNTLTKSLTQTTANQTPQTSQIDSQINVDISVKDADNIPTEISNNIIGPLKAQLATIQQQVNELMNLNRPRPAAA